MVHHGINKHNVWDIACALSSVRGFRNGVITGVRVRLPYIFQAIVYAVAFREGEILDRVRFVLRQMLFHGRTLALFVGIYKSICCVFRNFGVSSGIESLIAGFIGGYTAFGDSKGISGSVNNQIVLYLFARSIVGLIQSLANRSWVPTSVSVQTPGGFRVFAGITLALALYLTEYEPETLSTGFMSTMKFLYHKSDSGPLLGTEERKFLPAIIIVVVSLLGYLLPNFSLENITRTLFGEL